VLAHPRGGGPAVAELQADILSYGFRVNAPGSLSATLALGLEGADRSVLDPGRTELSVVRNGQTVWAGPLMTVSEDWSSRQLRLGAEGLLAYPRKWHVTEDLVHKQVDQALILKSLVDHHQNKAGGDFGLDTSSLTAHGVRRDRTYPGYELKNVYEAMVQLAEVQNGFHLEVDPATRKVLAHYPRKGRRRPSTVFDDRCIRSFTRDLDATAQVSQVLAVGAGEGDDMLRASRQNSSAVATYGLTQSVIVDKDVSIASTLVGKAQYRLDGARTVPNVIRLVAGTDDPPLFSWGINDEVRIVWDSPYDPVDEFQLVIGFDVTFRDGEESVTLYTEPLS